MSQTFTDDCFAAGHVGQTDLQNMEDNFAALKSAFSGAATPSDLVAGMFWYDTTAHILKLRNEANNAWLDVWDLVNDSWSGVTATEAEINTVADGAAVRNEHKHSNITVSAGTGLTGGGAISGDITINSTPALKGYSPLVMYGHDMTPVTATTGAYVTVINFRLYIPSTAGVLHMVARLKGSAPGTTAYAIMNVSGNLSGEASVTGITYGWSSEVGVDLSALGAGWINLDIQMKVITGTTAYLQGLSIVWVI